MADIFISHARNDGAWVKPFADALEAKGWSVWWDQKIHVGEVFDEVIADELTSARCVVVVWSHSSVVSRWVRSEADAAARRGILVPVVIDDAHPPLGFNLVEAAKLRNWKARAPHTELDRCIAAIEKLIGPATQPAALEDRSVPYVRRHWYGVLRTPVGRLAMGALVVLAAATLMMTTKELLDSWRAASLRRAVERMVATASSLPNARFTAAPGPPALHRTSAVEASTDLSTQVAVGVVLQTTETLAWAEGLQASAFAHVIGGKQDLAVHELEQAVIKKTADGALWSDLAAARFESAITHKRDGDLLVALTDADRAIQLDRSFPASSYNRALIVEQMGLANAAAAAWRIFLNVEGGSAWSEVARARLSSLQESRTDWVTARKMLLEEIDRGDGRAVMQIVRAYHEQAREYGETEVLGEWGGLLKDVSAAEQKLRIARAIGEALRQSTGESLLADAVTAIDRASLVEKAALASGHVSYRQAHAVHDSGKVSDVSFTEALTAFAGLSPMVQKVQYEVATVLIDQGRTTQALETLVHILQHERANAPTHGSLIGQVQLAIARCHVAQREWDDAIATSTDARRIFSALGESGNAGAADTLISEVRDYLGQHEGAWGNRVRAFRMTSAAQDLRRLHVALAGASRAEIAAARYDSALSLLNLEAQVVESMNDPVAMTEIMVSRSNALLRKGNLEAARTSVATARKAIGELSLAPLAAEKLTAQIDAVEAILVRPKDPRRSSQLLTTAIDFYKRASSPLALPDLYLERGQSLLAFGEAAAAERDFRAGIAGLNATLGTVAEPAIRANMLVAGERLFAELIRVLVRTQRIEEAFDLVEQYHTRALFDQIEDVTVRHAATGEAITGVHNLQARLAPGTTIVEFYLLPERMIVFTVNATGLRADVKDVPREQVAAASNALITAIDRREPLTVIQARSADLYNMLFGSVDLLRVRSLIVVPNDVLQRVPFAALFDKRTGHYMIEASTVSIVPSAHVFVATAQRERDLAGVLPSSVLVIESPAAELSPDYGSLPSLAGVAIEARGVAKLYPRASMLADTAATKTRFASGATASNVIHFVGHAVSDEVRPENSRLLLAAHAGESGNLYASEIARLNLQKVRLVVLSACSTMPVQIQGYEQKAGIADSFLAAGVPNVLATLGNFEDQAAARFFITLHRSVARGLSTTAATREAQLTMIYSGNRGLAYPGSWAPFEVLGGSADDLR